MLRLILALELRSLGTYLCAGPAFDSPCDAGLVFAMRPLGEPPAASAALGIIPARYGSTRLPGKPLVPIAGRPLVQHVWDRARAARRLGALLVATDDERIARVVRGFGGEAIMTSAAHASGTDRIAEAAATRSEAIVVNIQGDEPLVDPRDIDRLVEGLAADPGCVMATLCVPLPRREEAEDPNIVKVVCDDGGRALYFSRALVPWPRDAAPATGAGPAATGWQRHIGLYAYRREFLMEFASWPPSRLERTEGLEQLRVLERGGVIRVLPAEGRYLGVDTPEDVIVVESALARSA
jgi:3-deoxy-manno-octulosonate cytidylyltransferase (CMP-KDO synthetase)